ncbi:MAG: hypothetical protein ACRDAO_03695 [Culicoidibacterales bacterium]
MNKQTNKKWRESLIITGILAILVLVMTQFQRDIVIFVAIFFVLECLYLGIQALHEFRKSKKNN